MAHDHASLHRTPSLIPIHTKTTFSKTTKYRTLDATAVLITRRKRQKSTAVGLMVLPHKPDQCHDDQRADGEVWPHRQNVSLKGDFDVRKLTVRGGDGRAAGGGEGWRCCRCRFLVIRFCLDTGNKHNWCLGFVWFAHRFSPYVLQLPESMPKHFASM